jgi:hypothetical protein
MLSGKLEKDTPPSKAFSSSENHCNEYTDIFKYKKLNFCLFLNCCVNLHKSIISTK